MMIPDWERWIAPAPFWPVPEAMTVKPISDNKL
jgi:hypothetical protein